MGKIIFFMIFGPVILGLLKTAFYLLAFVYCLFKKPIQFILKYLFRLGTTYGILILISYLNAIG